MTQKGERGDAENKRGGVIRVFMWGFSVAYSRESSRSLRSLGTRYARSSPHSNLSLRSSLRSPPQLAQTLRLIIKTVDDHYLAQYDTLNPDVTIEFMEVKEDCELALEVLERLGEGFGETVNEGESV